MALQAGAYPEEERKATTQSPGATQVNPNTQAPAPAPQPAGVQVPTFTQLQQAGQPRPAPPDPGPQYTYLPPPGGAAGGAPAQGGDLRSQLSTKLMSLLANPSSYGTAQMQQEYNRKGQDIDDQYSQDVRRTDEEMARRGIFDSSVASGRLGDLNIGKRSAREEMANSLLQKLADTGASDTRAALGLGMQQDQYLTDERLRQAEMAGNAQSRAQQFALALKQMEQEGSQFDRSLQQRGVEFDRNYGLDQSRFGEQQRQFDVGTGLDTRRLDMQGNQFDKNYGLDTRRLDLSKQGMDQDFLTRFFELFGGLDGLGAKAPVSTAGAPPAPNAPAPQGAPPTGGSYQGNSGGMSADDVLRMLFGG